jgi:hypothetical protein
MVVSGAVFLNRHGDSMSESLKFIIQRVFPLAQVEEGDAFRIRAAGFVGAGNG